EREHALLRDPEVDLGSGDLHPFVVDDVLEDVRGGSHRDVVAFIDGLVGPGVCNEIRYAGGQPKGGRGQHRKAKRSVHEKSPSIHARCPGLVSCPCVSAHKKPSTTNATPTIGGNNEMQSRL